MRISELSITGIFVWLVREKNIINRYSFVWFKNINVTIAINKLFNVNKHK